MRKTIVYQTLNTENNKIYIGVHLQENPEIFDGYLGCGFYINHNYYIENPKVPLHFAIKKYGVKKFKRTTLAIYDTYEEALALEAKLVNEEFIKRKDTYNVTLGGNGGSYLFPINQFDLKGKLIYTWDNMKQAAEALGISHTSINNAKLYKTSCLGYFWSTTQEVNISEYTNRKVNKIYQYSDTGKFIQVFNSLTEAAKYINSEEKTLYRAIKSEIKHKNFYWSNKCMDSFVRKSIPNLKNKIIYIYDLQGNFIKEIAVGKGLHDYYQTTSYTNLKQALLNGTPYKGTQVSLVKYDRLSPCKDTTRAKKVGVYSLDGDLVEVFTSIKQAVLKYGTSVSRVIKGQQKHTKNLIFKLI